MPALTDTSCNESRAGEIKSTPWLCRAKRLRQRRRCLNSSALSTFVQHSQTEVSILHVLTFGRRLLQQLWPWLVQLLFFLACADSLIAINVSRRVSLLFGAFGFKTMADQSWPSSSFLSKTIYKQNRLSITSSDFVKEYMLLHSSINHKPNLLADSSLLVPTRVPIRWQDMSFSRNGLDS